MAQTLPATISSGAGQKGREEGSGDFKQVAVSQWNEIIFHKRNIARDLPQVYTSTVEPPKRGHFGNRAFVLSSEVVPISEVHHILISYHLCNV